MGKSCPHFFFIQKQGITSSNALFFELLLISADNKIDIAITSVRNNRLHQTSFHADPLRLRCFLYLSTH
jgi:hypothetical protein